MDNWQSRTPSPASPSKRRVANLSGLLAPNAIPPSGFFFRPFIENCHVQLLPNVECYGAHYQSHRSGVEIPRRTALAES
jgi:hypothetical protein